MAAERIYLDQDFNGNAVLNALVAAAPAWAPGRQLGGSLVWDAVAGGLFWVKFDMANSQTRPGLNAANYIPVSAPALTQDTANFFTPDPGLARVYGVDTMTLRRALNAAVATLPFSVRVYGAAGDGESDDTAAFQAAATAAGQVGGRLFLPAGTYLVSTVDIPSNVTVQGEGQGVSNVVSTSPNQYTLRALNTTSNVKFFDFTVGGAGAVPSRVDNGSGGGLWVAGTGCVVERVEVHHVVIGILCYGARQAQVVGNFVHDTGGDGIAQFSTYWSANVGNRIERNKLRRIGDDGISCVSQLGEQAALNEGLTVERNDLQDITGAGLSVWGGLNIKLAHNNIRNTYLSGIKIISGVNSYFNVGSVSNVKILHNDILNAGMFTENLGLNVQDKMGGILLMGLGNAADALTDVQVRGNFIGGQTQGSYISVISQGGICHYNLDINGNRCTGGNLPIDSSGSNFGKQGTEGSDHGIYVNAVQGLTVRDNKTDRPRGHGMFVGSNCVDWVDVSSNKLHRSNQAGASDAALRVDSGRLSGGDNHTTDPEGRLTTGIKLATSLVAPQLYAYNNQLYGLAFSGEQAYAAAGTGSAPGGPTGGGGTTTSGYSLTAPSTATAGGSVTFNIAATGGASASYDHLELFEIVNGAGQSKQVYMSSGTLPASITYNSLVAGNRTYAVAVYTTQTNGVVSSQVTIAIAAAGGGTPAPTQGTTAVTWQPTAYGQLSNGALSKATADTAYTTIGVGSQTLTVPGTLDCGPIPPRGQNEKTLTVGLTTPALANSGTGSPDARYEILYAWYMDEAGNYYLRANAEFQGPYSGSPGEHPTITAYADRVEFYISGRLAYTSTSAPPTTLVPVATANKSGYPLTDAKLTQS